MSVFESPPSTPPVLRAELPLLDEAQLAAAAFLTRYGGRTLESYRTDLRQFVQWARDDGLRPLDATRSHSDAGEQRPCAFHDRSTAVHRVRLLPVRAHRWTHRIQPCPVRAATTSAPHQSARHGPGRARNIGPILFRHDGRRLDSRTAYSWVRSTGKQAGLDRVHPHMLRAAFIMAALDAGVPLRDVQLAARHADPRTTTVYDRRRQSYDRHAAHAVVAFVTNG